MSYPFSNPIVGGGGELVRNRIVSRNYVPGVSGWVIERDGDAEFNDVTVRGQLDVVDPTDSSAIRIYVENPGDGAIIEAQPAAIPGSVVGSARIYTGTVVGPVDEAAVTISGPSIDGTVGPFLDLRARNDGTTLGEIGADTIELQTDHLVVYDANSTPGFEVTPDGTAPQNTVLALDGDDLGFACEVGSQLIAGSSVGLTNSATFANIPGAPTGSITKKSANTRLKLRLDVSCYADTIAGTPEFALRIDGTDVPICGFPISQANVRQSFGGTVMLSGVAAGTSINIVPRWRKSAGGGNIGRVAASETCSWEVTEVIA